MPYFVGTNWPRGYFLPLIAREGSAIALDWQDRHLAPFEPRCSENTEPSEASQAIVTALRVILTEGEKKAIGKARVANVQAYDFYLRRRQYFHQLSRKSLEFAKQMFNRAIQIDPDYAIAHAGVADSCSILYMYFDAREFNLKQADAASLKALELAASVRSV